MTYRLAKLVGIMKMPKDIKEKWVHALLSGKYIQGKGFLKTQDGKYCCLGVLEDVCDGKVETFSNHKGAVISQSFPSSYWLHEHKIVAGDAACEDLASMNDGGVSFVEIARIIERDVGILDE